MAYVDLRAGFDSLSRSLLWLLLTRLEIPDKIVRLIRAPLCTATLSAVLMRPTLRVLGSRLRLEFTSPRVCVDTRLSRYGRGLVAGKDC